MPRQGRHKLQTKSKFLYGKRRAPASYPYQSYPMKDNIKISIPTPCHQKWSSFTKTEQGGFCTSCQKEVIDFTAWSDDQVKTYFKSGSGKTCGRFRQEQLKAYYYDTSTPTHYGWISTFVAGGLLLFSSRQIFGQQRVDFAHHPTEQYEAGKTVGEIVRVPSPVLKITGVVHSPEDGLPLPGVNALHKGSAHGTITDGDGRFTITLVNPGTSPVLIFSFIGFETAEYLVSTAEAEQKIRIDMMYDKVGLQGEVIVGGCYAGRWYSPRTWWWKIKSLF